MSSNLASYDCIACNTTQVQSCGAAKAPQLNHLAYAKIIEVMPIRWGQGLYWSVVGTATRCTVVLNRMRYSTVYNICIIVPHVQVFYVEYCIIINPIISSDLAVFLCFG